MIPRQAPAPGIGGHRRASLWLDEVERKGPLPACDAGLVAGQERTDRDPADPRHRVPGAVWDLGRNRATHAIKSRAGRAA